MTLRHVLVELNLEVAASPAVVWDEITGDVSGWWGHPYVLIEDATGIHVEPWLGGLVRETNGRREAQWGVVVDLEPGARIAWHGPMGMGDAVAGTVTVTLDGDERTAVSLRHEAVGAFDEDTGTHYHYGWDDLLHRLRALVERGEVSGLRGTNRPVPEFTRQRPW